MSIQPSKQKVFMANSLDRSTKLSIYSQDHEEIHHKQSDQAAENCQNHKHSKNYSLNYEHLAHTKQIIRASYKQVKVCQPIIIESSIGYVKDNQQPINKNTSLWKKDQKDQIVKLKNNETKNIAKNYGKAIISFMQANKKLLKKVCRETSTPYQRIIQEISYIKRNLVTICGFRKIWTEYRYCRCIRMISHIFLRRHSLEYIFNSKIVNMGTHIKYRKAFLGGLNEPYEFNHIKQF